MPGYCALTMSATTRTLATTFACAFFVSACSGGGAQPSKDAGAGHDSGVAMPTYAPTLTAIYGEILGKVCAQPFCHQGAAGSPPLFPDKESSYTALVNAPARGMKCADAGPGLVLVVPGHPESSLLYHKIENPPPADLCGDPMPGGGAMSLDPRAIQQIQEWIVQGAMDN